MRKLILATASALVIGIGGADGTLAADMSGASQNSVSSGNPAMSGSSQYSQTNVNPSKTEIEQAQQQLRSQGLYTGAVDGVLGPETKQALEQFQQRQGLPQTATLDQATMERLMGNATTGQGSSMAPNTGSSGQSTGSVASPHSTSPGSSSLGGSDPTNLNGTGSTNPTNSTSPTIR